MCREKFLSKFRRENALRIGILSKNFKSDSGREELP
jgi:hypothetical protein